jgi:hypothetical protein
LAKKFVNFKACRLIIGEKLNLKNYLHDAMDFHAVRQLMVKSRHKILMPILVLQLTKTKLNQGEYRSSFGRNLHERTDRPVFTIEEAVSQLNSHNPKRTDVEKAMDDFFMTHLPEKVIKAAGYYQNNELDEDAVRRMKRSEIPIKKYRTQVKPGNGPQAFNRNRILPGDIPKRKMKRHKSDFTLAFMESSDQVAKLAYQSEVGQNIEIMRTVAKSQHRESILAPPSQFKRANPEIKRPSPIENRSIENRSIEYSVNRREISTPGAFKRRNSQQLFTDPGMMKRIESIVAERQAKHKPSTDKKNPAGRNIISTVKENPTDSSDSEKSQSDDNNNSDSIGDLYVTDDLGRPNTPADEVAQDESGDAKQDESGDAKQDESGDAKQDESGDAKQDERGDAKQDESGDAKQDESGDGEGKNQKTPL